MKKSVINAINTMTTVEEFNEVIGLINERQQSLRNAATREVKSLISKGSKVRINSQHHKGIATVERIKRTNAIINLNGKSYDCPLSMLSLA